MASATEQALMAMIETFDAWNSHKLPTADDTSERNLAKTVLDMEISMGTVINDPPMRNSNVDATIEKKMKWKHSSTAN